MKYCVEQKRIYILINEYSIRGILSFFFFFFFRFISRSAYLCIGFSRYLQRTFRTFLFHFHTLGILSSRMCQLFRKCRIPVELFDKQAGFGFVKSFIGEKLAHIVTKVCQFVDSCPVYMQTRTFSRTVYLYKYTEKNVNVKYISGKPV